MSVAQIGLILLGVGALMAALAAFFYFRARRFLESAVTAQGVVTDLFESSSSEGGTTYRPVVQFTTAQGQLSTFTGSVGSNPPRYQPGQSVKVLYSPTNPQDARLPGFFGIWFMPVFFGIFGATMLAVGIFLSLTGSDSPIGETPNVTTLPSELPGGLPSLPGDLTSPIIPDVPQGGEVLVIKQQGSGVPTTSQVSCDSIRGKGNSREVRLSGDIGTVTFEASPYTGPGPYSAGNDLEAGGSVFENEQDPVTGAVIFDKSEDAGVVNLVAGDTIASGAWDCKNV